MKQKSRVCAQPVCPHCRRALRLNDEQLRVLVECLEVNLNCRACGKQFTKSVCIPNIRPAELANEVHAPTTPLIQERTAPAPPVARASTLTAPQVAEPPFRSLLGNQRQGADNAAAAGQVPFAPCIINEPKRETWSPHVPARWRWRWTGFKFRSPSKSSRQQGLVWGFFVAAALFAAWASNLLPGPTGAASANVAEPAHANLVTK